jgi:hypothetical protein
MSKDELITLAINEIAGFESGSIFELSKTAKSFSLTDNEFFNEVLRPLLASGKLIPIYKLNTTKLYPNDWVINLHGLEKVFKFKDGSSLDGTNSVNVLVAYRVQ